MPPPPSPTVLNNNSMRAIDYLDIFIRKNSTKNFIFNTFGEEIYYCYLNKYINTNYHSYIYPSAFLQLYIFYHLCNLSFEHLFFKAIDLEDTSTICKNNNFLSGVDKMYTPVVNNYCNNGIFSEIFLLLSSLRIDFVSKAVCKNFNILSCSDSSLYFEKYIRDNFESIILQSFRQSICIEFAFTDDYIKSNYSKGLDLIVRGPFIRALNKDLQIKIDILEIKLELINKNGKRLIFDDTSFRTVTYSNFLKINFNLEPDVKYKLQIKWFPFAYQSDVLADIIRQMVILPINQYKFWTEGNRLCDIASVHNVQLEGL